MNRRTFLERLAIATAGAVSGYALSRGRAPTLAPTVPSVPIRPLIGTGDTLGVYEIPIHDSLLTSPGAVTLWRDRFGVWNITRNGIGWHDWS